MSAIWESANWTRQFGIRQTGNLLLNISLMKMLKRMGEITEPCGRPILVWNHTGSRSNRPQVKIIEELKLSSKYSCVLYQ
jgi:hypothetical protein